MFHAADSLYFQRDEKGNVTITKTDGNAPDEGGNVLFSQTIDAGIWASAVLSMTHFSERPGDWHAWMDHHNGKRYILEGRRGGY